MSTAKQQLMQVAIKKGDKTLIAKLALLANIEDGSRGVFLDNAYGDVQEHLTRLEWRQALATLARQGFYRASEDADYKGRYGYVVTEA